MKWKVLLHDDFEPEFLNLEESVQDRFLSISLILEKHGPAVGRPLVDTLKGSKFRNMKELRFRHKGEYFRFAFAFDLERNAVVLVGGSKRGKHQQRFYKNLVQIADFRFESHLSVLK